MDTLSGKLSRLQFDKCFVAIAFGTALGIGDRSGSSSHDLYVKAGDWSRSR